VVLRSTEVIVYDRQAEAAHHPRLTVKGGERLELDHHLEVLMRKPGALPGSTRWSRPVRPGRSPARMRPWLMSDLCGLAASPVPGLMRAEAWRWHRWR
jgi:hypothetical protein